MANAAPPWRPLVDHGFMDEACVSTYQHGSWASTPSHGHETLALVTSFGTRPPKPRGANSTISSSCGPTRYPVELDPLDGTKKPACSL